MKEKGPEDEAIAQLQIRVRKTEYPLGERTEVCSVHCPIVKGAVPLSRCESCLRYEAVLARSSEPSLLWCRVPAETIPKEIPTDLELSEKLKRTPVSQVMSQSVTCVDSELDLKELALIFEKAGIRAAPVVEDEGVVLGIVSQEDLVRARSTDAGGDSLDSSRFPPDCSGLLVEDIMTVGVVTLKESASLVEAMELMAAKDLHRIPVVSQDDVVVGVLSLVDLARWISGQCGGR